MGEWWVKLAPVEKRATLTLLPVVLIGDTDHPTDTSIVGAHDRSQVTSIPLYLALT